MNAEIDGRAVSVERISCLDDEGFTLLEVIVALALAALALVALFQAGSAGLLTANEATRVEAAVDRAQSHLAEFAGTGMITPGGSEGDDGDGYHWRLTARPITSHPAGASDQIETPATLYDVGVTVWWGTGRHRRSVELETERIGSVGVTR
jgi:general secretion pathway protein I